MNKRNKETANPKRVKIERRIGDHMSYYVDSNGLLKGEWGGYNELDSIGPNGEAMFEIFYNRFSQRTIINEYGLFYNIFSCKKYDGVLKLSEELYLCEKNERFGLLDNNEKSILHTCYNNIFCYDKKRGVFIVSTETGKFLFNYRRAISSEVYAELYSSYYNYFVYKESDMYGLMNENCEVVLKPRPEYEYKPDYNRDSRNHFYICFDNNLFGIKVIGDKLYGEIPINTFDLCFKVGYNFPAIYYITKKNSKYGLLNWKHECVTEPKYDEIIPYKGKHWIEVHRNAYSNVKGECVDVLFVICRKQNTYSLYNLQDCKCIISGCEQIDYKLIDDQYVYIEFIKKGLLSYVTISGIVIDSEDYDMVIKTRYSYIVSRDGKVGALNDEGYSIAPCIYDKIECNKFGELVATLNGKEGVLNPISKNFDDDNIDYEYERPSYGRYAGTYAQDEAGYSDDDIDTIFDGDPSAYWNID